MNANFCDVYAEKSAKQIDTICEIAEIGAVQKNAHLVRFLRTFGIVFFFPGGYVEPKIRTRTPKYRFHIGKSTIL